MRLQTKPVRHFPPLISVVFIGAHRGQDGSGETSSDHPAEMAGHRRGADTPEVKSAEENASGQDFKQAFGKDGEQNKPSGILGEPVACPVFCPDESLEGHEPMADSGQAAKALGLEKGSVEKQGCGQAPRRAGEKQTEVAAYRVWRWPGLPQEGEGSGVEESMIEADMNEGMGEQTPSFARQYRVWIEDQRLDGAAEQERQVEDENGSEQNEGEGIHVMHFHA